MEEKLQLIITGGNWERGGDYTKVTNITDEEFKELEPIIEKVMSREHYNWAIGTDLVRDRESKTGWRNELRVYGMYKDVDKELLYKFIKRCPNLIDSINEIRLQKVMVSDVKSYVR